MTSLELQKEFTSPEGIRTLANYLRSNIKIRTGILFDKRVDYFKGIHSPIRYTICKY